MRLPRLDWRVVPLVAALVMLAVLPALRLGEPPAPIAVMVDGRPMMAPPGATLGQALRVLHVEPEPGDLVDVEGVPLHRGVEPGSVLVNGAPGRLGMRLASGDVIEFVDGTDRVEPVTVDVVPVPEGGTPNPQTHVGAVPGEQIITTGAISGKLVSSAFRPTGGVVAPPQVALTFDDGPSPRYTPRILRILRRLGVRATFFVVGYLVDRYPAILRQIREAGMAIGNHSMNHPTTSPFEDLPPHEIREQVERSHGILEGLGVTPVGFRPPGGSWSGAVIDVASGVGERLILWSVDSEDFHRQKPRFLAEGVVKQAEAGSIVLLHDGGGNRTATVRALPRIINGLRRKGLEPVALG
ncbi:MAG: polysaccharide deacetylase family protein [Actinomycetota bacterium]|nr:polysaccharide deacetylase family protein [Actinomycetota bacterium]